MFWLKTGRHGAPSVWRRASAALCLSLALGLAEWALAGAAQSAQRRLANPTFTVDPSWPVMPERWTLGQVAGIAVDSRDHVWLLQRPWSLASDELAQNPEAGCCTAAPAVLEFDAAGRYVQGWGGPGPGYQWPMDEHGLHIDHKDNLWISSAGGPRLSTRQENQILKFTRDGRFLLQIGRRGMSTGSLDTANLNNAAGMYVHAPTNEVFVADGYVNRRVIVFDADTGAFKRMWGAYGRPPDDSASRELRYDGELPAQFNTVHAVAVSRDGVVYVADRRNNRVQIFSVAGEFQREVFIERTTRLLGTAFALAFSPDPEQRFLYVADAGNGRVRSFERHAMREVGQIGRIGRYAGQFVFLHALAVDSRGNLHTAEVGGGRRAQKFRRVP